MLAQILFLLQLGFFWIVNLIKTWGFYLLIIFMILFSITTNVLLVHGQISLNDVIETSNCVAKVTFE